MKGLSSLKVGLLVVAAGVVLAGCGNGLKGKYTNGVLNFEFKSGNKAYMQPVLGPMMEVTYKVDGDKVIVTIADGASLVFTRKKDGTLDTGMPFQEPLKKVDSFEDEESAAAVDVGKTAALAVPADSAASQSAVPAPPLPAKSAQAEQQPGGGLAYLSEMPNADRVLADMKGSSSNDTAAKQWGALYQLKDVIGTMSDGRIYRNELTPDEKRIVAEYHAAMMKIEEPKFDEEETQRLGRDSPRYKWFNLRTKYELDEAFREELLKRYLSKDSQAAYRAKSADE